MAVEIHAVQRPIQANFLPAKILKVPIVPVLLRLPIANSAMTSGIDQANKKINHGIRKVPPPLAPTILGNRQIFPVPIAAPIEAKIRPKRPLNWSDCAMVTPRLNCRPPRGHQQIPSRFHRLASCADILLDRPKRNLLQLRT